MHADTHGELETASDRRARVTAVALIETIGTAGALIGLGWRSGDRLRAFRMAGYGLFSNLVHNATPIAGLATFIGVAHHVVIAMAWGALLSVSLVTFRARARLVAVCSAVAIFAALQLTDLPPILRIGYTVTFDRAQMVAVSASVMLSLLMAWWTLSNASKSDAS